MVRKELNTIYGKAVTTILLILKRRKICVHPIKAVTVFHWSDGTCGHICEVCLSKVDVAKCDRSHRYSYGQSFKGKGVI